MPQEIAKQLQALCPRRWYVDGIYHYYWEPTPYHVRLRRKSMRDPIQILANGKGRTIEEAIKDACFLYPQALAQAILIRQRQRREAQSKGLKPKAKVSTLSLEDLGL